MPDQHYLSNGGVGVLVDLTDDDPVIVHWGADLGAAVPDAAVFTGAVSHSMFDVPVRPSLLPQLSRGWRGRTAVRGARGRTAFSPRFALTAATGDGARLTVTLADKAAALEVTVDLQLEPSGLLVVDAALTNRGADVYSLEGLDVVLPVPDHAIESLDTAGRWSREKHPQRRPIGQGTWVRTGRHGRTGHDAPAVLAAGTTGFGWRSGEVWAVHLGWSGDHESFVERLSSGHGMLGAGELLHPGEVRLAAGETYRTPPVYAAYAADGLDGVSARFHDFLRARRTHPSSPRPVVLNTWEAVYFDHDLDALTELADAAAALGVERFVLDDGWFHGRRDDHAGLGDWTVDPAVWPDGLTPLIDRVRGNGMQFGLWVEPEMVNANSDLVRAHPDWISQPAGRPPLTWRDQQVLDLANPDAWSHVLGQLDDLLAENAIDYLKWDQNRDQVELGHNGGASTREQTLAAYRLLDALRERHPGVEIESCSSGGGRVDLGILARTDRVWASDTNDALERQTIQPWTELIVPPELVGAHVGPTTSHTTARTHDLSFRAATALLGHFGIEWDIRDADADDLAGLKSAIEFYRAERDLIHSGRMVRMDRPDASTSVTGVVAHDGTRAVFVIAALATSAAEVPARIRFGGLAIDRVYEVRLGLPLGPHATHERGTAGWLNEPVRLSGAVLGLAGLPMPILNPEQAMVLVLDGAVR